MMYALSAASRLARSGVITAGLFEKITVVTRVVRVIFFIISAFDFISTKKYIYFRTAFSFVFKDMYLYALSEVYYEIMNKHSTLKCT
jgi:hypothetical protein